MECCLTALSFEQWPPLYIHKRAELVISGLAPSKNSYSASWATDQSMGLGGARRLRTGERKKIR